MRKRKITNKNKSILRGRNKLAWVRPITPSSLRADTEKMHKHSGAEGKVLWFPLRKMSHKVIIIK